LAARIARAYELALSPVGGFYVLVVTLLTSMKLIIALLPQEVKRYVVISLILFRNYLILNGNYLFPYVFSALESRIFHAHLCHSITLARGALSHSRSMR
jgi:hypothetical protein